MDEGTKLGKRYNIKIRSGSEGTIIYKKKS